MITVKKKRLYLCPSEAEAVHAQLTAAVDALRDRLVTQARAAGRECRDAAAPDSRVATLRKAAQRMLVRYGTDYKASNSGQYIT